jgi:hypothetical protein
MEWKWMCKRKEGLSRQRQAANEGGPLRHEFSGWAAASAFH